MEMIRSIPRPLVTESKRPLVTESRCPPAQDITAEKLRELLHYDPATGIFTRRVSVASNARAGDVAGSPNGDGYLYICIYSRLHRAHRLAWLYVYGTWPEDQLDHINRNRSDNRISNLREVSHKQNHQNRSKPSSNTSGHPGVHWLKQNSRWQARITHNCKVTSLGCFATIEEAISARKAAEKIYWADTQIAEPTPV